MSNWRNLPISERYNIWKLYRDAYPEMSHRDMIKHFDGGGVIGEKEKNQYTSARKITQEEYNNSFFDRASKEEYNQQTLRKFLYVQSEKLGDDYRQAVKLPLSDLRHITSGGKNDEWHTIYEPKGKPYLWRQYVDKTYPFKYQNGGFIEDDTVQLMQIFN